MPFFFVRFYEADSIYMRGVCSLIHKLFILFCFVDIFDTEHSTVWITCQSNNRVKDVYSTNLQIFSQSNFIFNSIILSSTTELITVHLSILYHTGSYTGTIPFKPDVSFPHTDTLVHCEVDVTVYII